MEGKVYRRINNLTSTKNLRLDANETSFFGEQLSYTLAKLERAYYYQLKMVKYAPLLTSVPMGTETVYYNFIDRVGKAGFIEDSTTHFPLIDIEGKRIATPVKCLGVAFKTTRSEIAKSKLSGIPLDMEKALVANEALLRLEDEIAAKGDSKSGLKGLFNNSAATSVTLAGDGTGSSKKFNTKDSKKIVRDVSKVINKIRTDTKDIHMANTCLMPVEQYTQLATTQNSDASDVSVLEYLKRIHPSVVFESYERLKGIGASNTDRIFAYQRSPDVVQMVRVQGIQAIGPHEEAVSFVTYLTLDTAGIILKRPKACAYADGI